MKTAAFTLVELLGAVVMIGILADAKVNVWRSVCMNNLRRIHLGLRMYSDDSADKAPQTSQPVDYSYILNLAWCKNSMKKRPIDQPWELIRRLATTTNGAEIDGNVECNIPTRGVSVKNEG